MIPWCIVDETATMLLLADAAAAMAQQQPPQLALPPTLGLPDCMARSHTKLLFLLFYFTLFLLFFLLEFLRASCFAKPTQNHPTSSNPKTNQQTNRTKVVADEEEVEGDQRRRHQDENEEERKPIGFIAEWMNAYIFISRKLNNHHKTYTA